MQTRARWLRGLGFACLTIDLPAHGESDGSRVTFGHSEAAAVEAAVERARQLVPGAPVGVIGISLGGASALLAEDLGVQAMVVESVFAELHTAIRNRCTRFLGPVGALAAGVLELQLRPRLGFGVGDVVPVREIGERPFPLFVLGGELDANTPPAETRALFEAARGPKELWIVPGAAHVDLYHARPAEYERRVGGFLGRWFPEG